MLKTLWITLSIFIPLYVSTQAAQAVDKIEAEPLFWCRAEDPELVHMELSIHRRLSGYGPQKFLALYQGIDEAGERRSGDARLNLTYLYDGRVLNFTSAQVRARIKRMNPVMGKFQAFIQIPSLGVYSSDWTCKGPSFEELPQP